MTFYTTYSVDEYEKYLNSGMQSSYIPPAPQRELYFIYDSFMSCNTNYNLLIREDLKFVTQAQLNNYSLVEVYNGKAGIVPRGGNIIMGELYELGKDNIAILDIVHEGALKQRLNVITNYGSYTAIAYVWPETFQNKKVNYNMWDRSIEEHSLNVGFFNK